jgi:hypothetical protein
VTSIDVGDRQKGRVSTKSIHKSPAVQDSIGAVITGILNGQALHRLAGPNPAEAVTVGDKITQSILNHLQTPGLNKKIFFDL